MFTAIALERAQDRPLDVMAHYSALGFIYDNVQDHERKEVPTRPIFPYGPTDPRRVGAGHLEPKDIVEVRYADTLGALFFVGLRGGISHFKDPFQEACP